MERANLPATAGPADVTPPEVAAEQQPSPALPESAAPGASDRVQNGAGDSDPTGSAVADDPAQAADQGQRGEAQGDASPSASISDPAGPAALTPHAGVIYGLMRMGLLIAVGGMLYVAGLRGWLWVLVTSLASALASWFLLVKQREAAARNLAAAAAARHERAASREHGTDPEVDAVAP